MIEFNFENFKKSIERELSEARRFVDNLTEHLYTYESANKYRFDEKFEFDEQALEHYINKAVLKLQFALEYLQLKNLKDNFNSDFSRYKKTNSEFQYVPYIGIFVNPIVDLIQMYADAICSQIDESIAIKSKAEERYLMLEQILLGTPKIIFDRNVEPRNETEIKKAIHDILIHVFPDTVREIPISKVSKVYKPDIGIRSLKAAVEYKFADSAEEIKKCIGGIFEDVNGYNGSEDWKKFYAVIYQTEHFLTQSQVEEEFKLSKVDASWKPILVYGKGKRITKNKNPTIKKIG